MGALLIGAWALVVRGYAERISKLEERCERLQNGLGNLGDRVDNRHSDLRDRVARLEGRNP